MDLVARVHGKCQCGDCDDDSANGNGHCQRLRACLRRRKSVHLQPEDCHRCVAATHSWECNASVLGHVLPLRRSGRKSALHATLRAHLPPSVPLARHFNTCTAATPAQGATRGSVGGHPVPNGAVVASGYHAFRPTVCGATRCRWGSVKSPARVTPSADVSESPCRRASM